MANLSIDARATLSFACRRHITVLFKEMLGLLEGIADEHDESLGKLAKALPTEYHQYLALADYLTEDRGERLRRAILGRGNDCIRAVLEEIDKHEVIYPTTH